MKHLTPNDKAYFKARKRLAELEALSSKLWIATDEFKKNAERSESAAWALSDEMEALRNLIYALLKSISW